MDGGVLKTQLCMISQAELLDLSLSAPSASYLSSLGYVLVVVMCTLGREELIINYTTFFASIKELY
jgi:glycerol kinase